MIRENDNTNIYTNMIFYLNFRLKRICSKKFKTNRNNCQQNVFYAIYIRNDINRVNCSLTIINQTTC